MNVSEAVNTNRACVVQIRVIDPQQRLNDLLGTGFFVSEEAHVITALHVINAIPAANRNLLRVAIASPNIDTPQLQMRANFSLVNCEILDEDERNDLALLRLSRNPFRNEIGVFARIGEREISYLYAVPSFRVERPDDGVQIAVSGYPLSSPALLTNAGWLATAWATDTREVQIPEAPAGFTRPDMVDVYVADVRVNPGNSGGPVYLIESGEVIGVCVSHSMAPVYSPGTSGKLVPTIMNGVPLMVNSGIANIIPVKYVTALMARNNVEVETLVSHVSS